jgi:hypothetical protein
MFRKLSITFLLSFLICPQLRAVDSGPSETERIQELERVVAELKQEVSGLKKQAASAAEVGARMKTKIMSEGKSYVEKAVVEEEKPPVFVVPRGSEFGDDQFDEVIGRVQAMF